MVKTGIGDPLGGLARRVARGDRSALAGLHDTLAPEVLQATFVEVWRMARYHTSAGTVRGRFTGVADRRAAEHVRGSSNRVGRGAYWFDVIAVHEAQRSRARPTAGHSRRQGYPLGLLQALSGKERIGHG